MLNLCKFLFLGALILIPSLSYSISDKEKKNYMFGDLEFIRNIFQVSYAPAEWKQKCTGWNLEDEVKKAKEKINAIEHPTSKDFQKIIKDFCNSAKDYHVGIAFYSTESASLPFRVKSANGKYYFSYIDQNRLSPHVFSFKEGDELVYFDGRTTDDVVNELKYKETGNVNEGTDQALAEIYLTNRLGMLGHEIPKGPIIITVRCAGSETLSSFQLIWHYNPEKVNSACMLPSIQRKLPLAKESFFQKKLIPPFYEPLVQVCGEDEESRDIVGSKKSFIPTLGRLWWESDTNNSFHAYLFENEHQKRIGYIRIASYLAGEDQVKEFAEIIKFFQERSDALIIDQINNPGGSLFYLYALASMLSNQPLHTPRHRMTITPEDVYFAIDKMPIFERIQSDEDARDVLGETFVGIPVTYQMAQFFLNFFRFIVDEWNAGRSFTNPFYLFGIDHINPDPDVNYTKPILLLVNHLDFSGGDFFPAILQDNKRVTILGTRTAGAGGYMHFATFPNLYGIAYFHYTASIAERTDRNPIENSGVTPDIIYDITKEDLQFGYQEYAKAIQKAINDLLQ